MAGLPTFWPITFHLFASYSRMAASRATLFDGQPGESEKTVGGHGYLVFAKLGIVHVLRGRQLRMEGAPECRRRTLYQCFLTEPSVRVGKVFAISLHELPASRMLLSRCSSAAVHGVLVRGRLAGAADAAADDPEAAPAAAPAPAAAAAPADEPALAAASDLRFLAVGVGVVGLRASSSAGRSGPASSPAFLSEPASAAWVAEEEAGATDCCCCCCGCC